MKTYKQLLERINMAKAKMGDVIKDFQASDAPQFKGKSQEKRRQMAIAAKMAAEEVEQIDELSSDTLKSYVKKARPDSYAQGGNPSMKKRFNRIDGVNKAHAKMAAEEVELEEGRMKEIAMDMENMGEKDFKAKHRKSKQEMKDSLTSKEEVEQIEESDLKPFIVVHAKHGKFETHAASTYEAAKNAAAHWKTKKGTSGMDVHRADITHSTQHVG